MNLLKIIFRNLCFFKRTNILIITGIIISIAVLTGALIVGNSVKYSLKKIQLQQLGSIKYSINGGEHFFTTNLEKEIEKNENIQCQSYLALKGIVLNIEKQIVHNKVFVYGINDNFFQFWKNSNYPTIKEDEVFLSKNLSLKLGVKEGSEIILKLPTLSHASQNAPFVSQENSSLSIRVIVKRILEDETGGRFSLQSNQQAPFNLFISYKSLAKILNIEGFTNNIVFSSTSLKKLENTIRKCQTPLDAGLVLKEMQNKQEIDISSKRIFIEHEIANIFQKNFHQSKKYLTWLINSIQHKNKICPYSFVSAINDTLISNKCTDSEIIINQWLADDLSVKTGDSINLIYYKIGILRQLEEHTSKFCIKQILPNDNILGDSSLMPKFPGISEAGNCSDWQTGVPINLKLIRQKDEEYWNIYRGKPKAFISLKKGIELWGNQYGNYTSFRLPKNKENIRKLDYNFMQNISPKTLGLEIRNVAEITNNSVENSINFSELFLSLSFFLILASFLLLSLLFIFLWKKRRKEIGIYAAIGISERIIFKIFFLEAIFLFVLGCIPGVILAIVYNMLIINGLNTIWQSIVHTNSLQLFISFSTISIGLATSVFLLICLLFPLLKRLLHQSLIFSIQSAGSKFSGNFLKSKILFFLCIFSSISTFVILYRISGFTQPQWYLASGFLFLITGIVGIRTLLLYSEKVKSENSKNKIIHLLKTLNYRRSQNLSVLTLLAIGTFIIIITGANKKITYGQENIVNSGTGGFLFWAETTLPILHNLNTKEGKTKYNLEEEKLIQHLNYIHLFKRPGDDASCLNLNQISNPAILGVPSNYFYKKKSFSFLSSMSESNTEKIWLELQKDNSDSVVNAIADQNVITWSIKKKIGDTIYYNTDNGKKIGFRLVASLNNSVFQGHIIIDEKKFHKIFNGVSGSNILLIEGNSQKKDSIQKTLENIFTDYGLVLSLSTERLAAFNSVENTYLIVFMILGGMGIVIGTLGIGIVLVRNIQDRSKEIVLYNTLGYEDTVIKKMIFKEFCYTALTGIFIGIISAILGIIPYLNSASYTFPSNFILVIIFLIITNTIIWIWFPLKITLKRKKLDALRDE